MTTPADVTPDPYALTPREQRMLEDGVLQIFDDGTLAVGIPTPDGDAYEYEELTELALDDPQSWGIGEMPEWVKDRKNWDSGSAT